MTAPTWLSWLAGIDWPTIAAFVVVEVLVVLAAAPRLIQKRNEDRAVAVFTTKLLPLFPAPPVVPSVAELANAVRTELQSHLDTMPTADLLSAQVRDELDRRTPSAEDQAAAQAQLVAELAAGVASHVEATVPTAVQLAVEQAVKGRMGALSEKGVEARQSEKAMEWAFRQAIARKGGWKASAAIVALKMAEPKLIKEGAELFALNPEGFDAWWDEHGAKFLGTSAKPKAAANGLRAL